MNEYNPKPTKSFLVLEDDANDALMIQRAFTNAACFAFVCRNTSEARAYLLGAGMYADRPQFPFPDIFVTDLRLGEESGISFLTWIRGEPELRDLQAIVLSAYVTPRDVPILRELDVRVILEKPSNPLELEDLLRKVSERLCPEPQPSIRARQRREDYEFAT